MMGDTINTHTCSEQSLRILMWNASREQKYTPIIPDRNGSVKRPEKESRKVAIAIVHC